MANRNDVAARAGVSPAVVSYVFNNSNYVSDEKRQAVLKAAKEMEYYPNYAARSLKANRTRQLLLVSDDIRNEVFSDMAYYMERIAFDRGYFLSTTSVSRKKAMNFEKVFYSRQYDAILLANNVYSQNEINRIAKQGVPIVLYQTRFYENLDPSVTIIGTDLKKGTAQLVDYLAAKGHTRIGYIGNPSTPVTPGEAGPFGEGMRINGYLEAMEGNMLQIHRELIFTNFLKLSPDSGTPENESLEETLEQVLRKIIAGQSSPHRATAYMVTTDLLAAMLVMRLQEQGIRIPEDLEITGFGDTNSGRLCRPQLTTMQIPTEEIAKAALAALVDKCKGEKTANKLFPPRLIVRQSA